MTCLNNLLRAFAAIWVAFHLGTAAVAAEDIAIELDGSAFKVVGWKAPSAPPVGGWSSILLVYAGREEVPPLLGSYAVEGGTLVFRPAYPIAPGVQYRVEFHASGGASLEKIVDGPRLDTSPVAHVLRVYPTAEVLPSNQLRLYIYFSTPMSRGEAVQYVHILDESGEKLEGAKAVLLPGQELWDPNYQRLTLTFDPGRIKRGLTSNQTIGPPISEGKRYTLVIDRDWPDARGVPMSESFQKAFRGGPAERTPLDPAQWRLNVPKLGTSDPLIVTFPKPMNFPLLQRMIEVSGSRRPIEGTIDIDHQETQWRFTPREAWKSGDYDLVVDARVEDLAGNHIGQPFDIDTFERVTEHISTTTISLPFAIK